MALCIKLNCFFSQFQINYPAYIVDNLFISSNVVIPQWSKKGTIITKELKIPENYSIADCLVVCRIDTSNLENNSTYPLESSTISYSYTTNGLIKVSPTEDINENSRRAHIFAVLRKK